MLVNVNVSFEVADQATAEAEVNTWNLPEGANVNVSIAPALRSGTVQEGSVVQLEPITPLPMEQVTGSE
jgi:hypothetical protein